VAEDQARAQSAASSAAIGCRVGRLIAGLSWVGPLVQVPRAPRSGSDGCQAKPSYENQTATSQPPFAVPAAKRIPPPEVTRARTVPSMPVLPGPAFQVTPSVERHARVAPVASVPSATMATGAHVIATILMPSK
jgi:hypothetical protein